MQHNDRDLESLRDMRRYARRLLVLVEHRSRADLNEPEMRAALERFLEIVGEAARRVSSEFREAHPDIPWSQVVALRNVLAHQYASIDLDTLWDVATTRVPELLLMLDQLIPPGSDEC